jgi:hypothetical protein
MQRLTPNTLREMQMIWLISYVAFWIPAFVCDSLHPVVRQVWLSFALPSTVAGLPLLFRRNED